jgi:hypothetical protein
MFREPKGKPDPKPVKQPKPKFRKVKRISTKNLDKEIQIKQLIIDLDKVFSIFIRQRGMSETGLNSCYTCGKVYHWTNLQAGHYLSRRYYGTRWSPENVFCQCLACNMYHEGNKPAFVRHLIKDFGLPYLEHLEILKNRMFKLEIFNLKILIQHYQNLIQ